VSSRGMAGFGDVGVFGPLDSVGYSSSFVAVLERSCKGGGVLLVRDNMRYSDMLSSSTKGCNERSSCLDHVSRR